MTILLTLGILLSFSLSVNLLLLSSPLYRLNFHTPDQNGGEHQRFYQINSTINRKSYFSLMNILETYKNTPVYLDLEQALPDLIITRDVPCYGLQCGSFGIFFLDELAYIFSGTQYEGQQLYQFDYFSTDTILKHSHFKQDSITA